MNEATDPAQKKGSSSGNLLLMLLVLAAIAYAGKLFYAEVVTLDPVTSTGTASDPASPSPASASVAAGETPDQLVARRVAETSNRIQQVASPVLDEIDKAPERQKALAAKDKLEKQLSLVVTEDCDQLRKELHGTGATASVVDDGCKRIDAYAKQWLTAAADRAGSIPEATPGAAMPAVPMPAPVVPAGGAVVPATPPPPVPPGGAPAALEECIEPVTSLGRDGAMKFQTPLKQEDTYTQEVARLAARWPFIVRTHAERKSDDANFIWDVLCTQDERNRAQNEFARKDLLAAKQDLFKKGLDDAVAVKRIRYRTTLRFGNYDFEKKQLALQDPLQAQLVSPLRRGGVIRAYRMTARGLSDRLVTALPMDEEQARKIIGQLGRSDSRYMFCDIEGMIINATESAMLLQVQVGKLTVSAADGSKSWDIPVE